MSWFRRFANLFRRDSLARDIDWEMAFHIGEKADDLEASGLNRADAEREARRSFGHRGTLRERTRDVDVLGWLESLMADLRYALRALKANPGFTLVATLSLGLGIGANTAIFSLVNAVVLRSLPVDHPEELVEVSRGDEGASFTNPIWEALRDTPGMDRYFAYGSTGFNLDAGGEVRRASGAWVSGSFFPVLRVRPIAGRLLEPADDRRGCQAVTVVSEGFAAREFGSAAAAVGRTLSLRGEPFLVLGVVEPRFSGMEVGDPAAIYAPICAIDVVSRGEHNLDKRSRWFLSIYGRRHAGLQAERALLARVAPTVLAATIPQNWSGPEQAEYAKMTLTVRDAAGGYSGLRATYREALFVLLVVVATVLIIGCANVANLLLARSAARQHELAVRLAIGAGRWRLVRQLLTESLLLAFAGGVAGLFFARWSSALLVRFLSTRNNAVFLDLALDGRVLLFSVAAATVTGLLFGLAPAWRVSRVDPQSAMKAQGRGITAASNRFGLGQALVVGQVALSLVLVVAAGLLMGSFRKLVTMDPGFRSEGVLLVSMDLARTGWPPVRQRAVRRQLLDGLRAMPGVSSAGASFTTPLSNSMWNDLIAVSGYSPATSRDSTVMFNSVSEGWFTALGTDLVAGRDFTSADGTGAVPVVIINETLARRFFGTAAPLGRTLRVTTSAVPGPPLEVVGVVRDAKYQSLREENQPTAYVPLDQGEWFGTEVNFELRTAGAPFTLIPAVKAVAAKASPAITLELSTFDEQVDASLRRPRLLATLSGFFAVLALTLAVIGLYGTVAYGVARRRAEIGIRLALGAARGRVLRMVLGEAGKLVLVGIVAGLVTALGTTRLLGSFLYGLSASDARTLTVSVAALAAVALGASLIPAWRAASLDPTETLREE